jgi:hypothetical protein
MSLFRLPRRQPARAEVIEQPTARKSGCPAARIPSVKASPPPAPPKQGKQFPPSVKKERAKGPWDREVEIDVRDGIIAHLTRECGGNVDDHNVVGVTSSKPYNNWYWTVDRTAANYAVDLETDSCFFSAFRGNEDVPHTRNSWVCCDFKERKIVPTHCTIRTNNGGPGNCHLKSWLVEKSADGKSWREVGREEDNRQLNAYRFTGAFAVAGCEECRFVRLGNVGRNHFGTEAIWITAWEIFGTLIR